MIFSIVLATVITIHPNFLLAQSTDDTLAIRINPTEKDCIESCFSVKAVRIMIPPKVDGILDELIWDEIEPITDFRQRIPVDGGNPTEKTEVRIAYDQDNLYFGFKLLDSEPDKIIRTIYSGKARFPLMIVWP